MAGGGSRSEGVGRPHAGRPHARKPQAPSGHGSLTASASPGFSFRPNAKPCSQDRFCPQPLKFSAPPGGPSEAVTALGLMVEKRAHARFVDSTGGNVSVCLLPAGQRASRRGDSGAHGGQQARRGPGFHEVGVHSLTHSRTHSFTQQTPTAPVRASSTLGAGAVDGKAWCSCRSARFPLVETDDQQRGNTQLHEVGAPRGNRRVRGRRQGRVLAGTPPRGDAGGGLQSRATPAEAGA